MANACGGRHCDEAPGNWVPSALGGGAKAPAETRRSPSSTTSTWRQHGVQGAFLPRWGGTFSGEQKLGARQWRRAIRRLVISPNGLGSDMRRSRQLLQILYSEILSGVFWARVFFGLKRRPVACYFCSGRLGVFDVAIAWRDVYNGDIRAEGG